MGLVRNKLVLTNRTLAGHRGQPRWQGHREGEKAPVNRLAVKRFLLLSLLPLYNTKYKTIGAPMPNEAWWGSSGTGEGGRRQAGARLLRLSLRSVAPPGHHTTSESHCQEEVYLNPAFHNCPPTTHQHAHSATSAQGGREVRHGMRQDGRQGEPGGWFTSVKEG